MAKKKSKVDINVVEDLLKRGYTYKQIAIETNSSLNNIRYLAIKNGLDKYSKHRRLAHALEKDVIEKHLKQGLTYTDIGKIYGFSGQTIGSLAHQYGLDEYNVAKSYKYLNINIIKDLLINGESYFSIAAKFGVGERYIRKICEENGIDKFNSNIRHIYYIYPIDSAIKAYILGFIICDASINYNNSVKIKISAIDYYTLSMIANELGSKILVDTNFITKNGTCSDIIRTIKTIYNIDNIFRGRLKHDRIPPFNIIPEEYLRYFIRGIIEADGTIYINKKIDRFHVDIYSSYNIIFSVKTFLESYLNITCCVDQCEGCYRLTVGNIQSIWILLNWIYPRNGFITMPRKYEKAIMILEWFANKNNHNFNYDTMIKPFTINIDE